jgi:hypothetical protein
MSHKDKSSFTVSLTTVISLVLRNNEFLISLFEVYIAVGITTNPGSDKILKKTTGRLYAPSLHATEFK